MVNGHTMLLKTVDASDGRRWSVRWDLITDRCESHMYVYEPWERFPNSATRILYYLKFLQWKSTKVMKWRGKLKRSFPWKVLGSPFKVDVHSVEEFYLSKEVAFGGGNKEDIEYQEAQYSVWLFKTNTTPTTMCLKVFENSCLRIIPRIF